MKDVYYFSHDSNARRDPKMVALMSKYGPEGYGVYFMLIEILSEQHSYKIEKFPRMADGLARDMGIKPERLSEILAYILTDCELLKQDDKYIWSDSLMRRKAIQEEKRKDRIEAGRIGGLRSGQSRSKTKQNEAMLEANEAHLEATNQSKVKESKANESKEHLWGNGFRPPTLEEVSAYCEERKNGINPSKFIDHYATNGWMRGKTKIKDWKACVRTWEGRDNPKPASPPVSNWEQEQLERVTREHLERQRGAK